ncbi:hypothetical protein [Fibrobacter sp. UWT3]|uniref:hypothetical protein n=1 Tax=Fibrobacter sp. UWT3 TaxID=1896225 RepID=UPI000BE398DD|nr:hypothetical protein [Fibrobacter sp. UWT3]
MLEGTKNPANPVGKKIGGQFQGTAATAIKTAPSKENLTAIPFIPPPAVLSMLQIRDSKTFLSQLGALKKDCQSPFNDNHTKRHVVHMDAPHGVRFSRGLSFYWQN